MLDSHSCHYVLHEVFCITLRNTELQPLCIHLSPSKSASIGRLFSDDNFCMRQSDLFLGTFSQESQCLQSLGSQNQKGWKWVIPTVWPDIFSSTFEIIIFCQQDEKPKTAAAAQWDYAPETKEWDGWKKEKHPLHYCSSAHWETVWAAYSVIKTFNHHKKRVEWV